MVDPFDPKKHITVNSLTAAINNSQQQQQQANNNSGTWLCPAEEDPVPGGGTPPARRQIDDEIAGESVVDSDKAKVTPVENVSTPPPNRSRSRDSRGRTNMTTNIAGRKHDRWMVGRDDSLTGRHVPAPKPVVDQGACLPGREARTLHAGRTRPRSTEVVVHPPQDVIRVQAKDYENYLFHNSLNIL